MTFIKQILTTVSLAAFALGGCATSMSADDASSQPVAAENMEAAQAADPAEKFDIAKLTCWDISTLPEEDAGYASLLLFGYNAGASGQSMHSGSGIESAIVKAGETCATRPDMMAIQAFK